MKTLSDRFADPDELLMAEIILELITERGTEKTICPSEAARAFAPEEEWRSYMEMTRQVAREMEKLGYLEFLQKGKRVELEGVKGPLRLRWTGL